MPSNAIALELKLQREKVVEIWKSDFLKAPLLLKMINKDVLGRGYAPACVKIVKLVILVKLLKLMTLSEILKTRSLGAPPGPDF